MASIINSSPSAEPLPPSFHPVRFVGIVRRRWLRLSWITALPCDAWSPQEGPAPDYAPAFFIAGLSLFRIHRCWRRGIVRWRRGGARSSMLMFHCSVNCPRLSPVHALVPVSVPIISHPPSRSFDIDGLAIREPNWQMSYGSHGYYRLPKLFAGAYLPHHRVV